MKKFLAFALVALAVTAAQAVTINWTLKLGGPSTATTGPDSYGYGPGYVGLCVLQGAVNKNDFFSNKSGAVTANSDTTDYTLAGVLAGATKIKVTDTAYYGDLGQSWGGEKTLSFSADATGSAVTFVLFNAWAFNPNGQNTTYGYGLLTVTDLSAETTKIDLSDMTFNWGKFTESYASVSAVPEPTVLALLALGVAGLALKRKVA